MQIRSSSPRGKSLRNKKHLTALWHRTENFSQIQKNKELKFQGKRTTKRTTQEAEWGSSPALYCSFTLSTLPVAKRSFLVFTRPSAWRGSPLASFHCPLLPILAATARFNRALERVHRALSIQPRRVRSPKRTGSKWPLCVRAGWAGVATHSNRAGFELGVRSAAGGSGGAAHRPLLRARQPRPAVPVTCRRAAQSAPAARGLGIQTAAPGTLGDRRWSPPWREGHGAPHRGARAVPGHQAGECACGGLGEASPRPAGRPRTRQSSLLQSWSDRVLEAGRVSSCEAKF